MSVTANGVIAGPLDLDYEPVRARDSMKARQYNLLPVNTGNLDNDLVFKFTENSKGYKQLESCKLYIQARVVRGDGRAIASLEDSVTPINLMGPALFSECRLEVQDEYCSELSTTNYPYKNYFDILLSFGTDALATHLPLLGYHADTPEFFQYNADENEGASKRRKIIENSQKWEVMSPILNDLLRSRQELYPEIPFKVTFVRTPPRFYFTCEEGDIANDYRVKIESAELTLNYIDNEDEILRAHSQLFRTRGLKMHMTKTQIKTFDIAAGQNATHFSIQDGILPHLLIIGMVSSAAFYGCWTKYPFYFHHYNLREGWISVDGDTMPAAKYQPKFEGGNEILFFREYIEFMTNIGQYFNSGTACLVTPDAYRQGSFFMAFDLTSDRYVLLWLANGFDQDLSNTFPSIKVCQFPPPRQGEGKHRAPARL